MPRQRRYIGHKNQIFELARELAAGFFLEMSFRRLGGEIAFVGRENAKHIQLAA